MYLLHNLPVRVSDSRDVLQQRALRPFLSCGTSKKTSIFAFTINKSKSPVTVLSNSLTSHLKVYNCILHDIRQNKAIPLLPALRSGMSHSRSRCAVPWTIVECTQQHSTCQLITTCNLPAQEQIFYPERAENLRETHSFPHLRKWFSSKQRRTLGICVLKPSSMIPFITVSIN